MMTKSTLIKQVVRSILVVTLLSLSAPGVLRAQTPDDPLGADDLAFGRPGMGVPARLLGPLFPILRRLNLSVDQRGRVKEIVQSHRADFQALIRRGIQARKGLFEAVFLDPFDEQTIRDRSGAEAAVQADEAVLRGKIRTEIFEVLTPEQQERATQLLKMFEQRLRRRIDVPTEG